MLEGYVGLASMLNGQKQIGEATFDSAVTTLKARDNKDAKFYEEQLLSVRTVFQGK